MTLLSDKENWDLLEDGKLVIDPAPELDAVSPSTVDIRLGSRFTRSSGGVGAAKISIDTRDTDRAMEALEAYSDEVDVTADDYFPIDPGDLVLGWTMESFQLPDDIGLALKEEARSRGSACPLTGRRRSCMRHSTGRFGWRSRTQAHSRSDSTQVNTSASLSSSTYLDPRAQSSIAFTRTNPPDSSSTKTRTPVRV
jgi:hypothetical protein